MNADNVLRIVLYGFVLALALVMPFIAFPSSKAHASTVLIENTGPETHNENFGSDYLRAQSFSASVCAYMTEFDWFGSLSDSGDPSTEYMLEISSGTFPGENILYTETVSTAGYPAFGASDWNAVSIDDPVLLDPAALGAGEFYYAAIYPVDGHHFSGLYWSMNTPSTYDGGTDWNGDPLAERSSFDGLFQVVGDESEDCGGEEPPPPEDYEYATTTEGILREIHGDINFGLAILIFFNAVIFWGFFFNTFAKTPR